MITPTVEEVKMICDKCGAQQVPNEEESDKNWKVYPNVPCECGGAFMPDFTKKRKN